MKSSYYQSLFVKTTLMNEKLNKSIGKKKECIKLHLDYIKLSI